MRRGRGFNAQEVANLRSWGVEPRPDEIEPTTRSVTTPLAELDEQRRRRYELMHNVPELSVLAQQTSRGRYDEIMRMLGARLR